MKPANNGVLPTVSIIVSVYNEDQVISEKLKNLELIDYPIERIETLIGSDGSSDGTNDILRGANVRNLRPLIFQARRGKASVLNELVALSRADILLFSDANTFFRTDTVKKLVHQFHDPSVGAVCGELVLEPTGGMRGETSYWNYENMLKNLESNLDTTIAATGAVYAIRRDLFVPLPTDKVVMDDFLIALNVIKNGKKVKYEPSARAYERSSDSVGGEFRRRSRIGAANFHGVSEFASLLHPRYGFVAFALWSHKIIRWSVPFLLIAMFATDILLAGMEGIYRLIFWAEWALIGLGLLGFLSEKMKLRIGILSLPYYFVAMNAALLVGFVRFVLNRQRPTWDVVR